MIEYKLAEMKERSATPSPSALLGGQKEEVANETGIRKSEQGIKRTPDTAQD
jgi:hypothetical protein